MTANGPVQADRQVSFGCPALGADVDALLLKDSPHVLSAGRLVDEEKLDVYWLHGHCPYIIKPDGEVVWLSKHNNVPYVDNSKPGDTATENNQPPRRFPRATHAGQ